MTRSTQSESHSNSLTESLELSAGETVEAGVSFGGVEAKTTLDFTQTFGLTTESIAEYSESSEHSVKGPDRSRREHDDRFRGHAQQRPNVMPSEYSGDGRLGRARHHPARGSPIHWRYVLLPVVAVRRAGGT